MHPLSAPSAPPIHFSVLPPGRNEIFKMWRQQVSFTGGNQANNYPALMKTLPQPPDIDSFASPPVSTPPPVICVYTREARIN